MLFNLKYWSCPHYQKKWQPITTFLIDTVHQLPPCYFILPGRRQRSGLKERDIYTIYKHETFAFSPSLSRLVACMFVLRFHDASQVSGVFKTWRGGGWVRGEWVGGFIIWGGGSAPPPSLEEKPGATHWNVERRILDIPAKASITHRFINVAVTPDFLHKQLYCNHMKHT